MGEALCGTLRGKELAAYFQKNWADIKIRYLLFRGIPNLENTVGELHAALRGLIDAGFTPVSAAEFQACNFYQATMTELMADSWRSL